MSETQYKVTGGFDAVDENGNQFRINEYTLFRHTTTSDMAAGIEGNSKEYRLGNGAAVTRISDTEFEIVSEGTRIYRSVNQNS